VLVGAQARVAVMVLGWTLWRAAGREEGYNDQVEWEQCGGRNGNEALPREEEVVTTRASVR
jgi:hypothetical protein